LPTRSGGKEAHKRACEGVPTCDRYQVNLDSHAIAIAGKKYGRHLVGLAALLGDLILNLSFHLIEMVCQLAPDLLPEVEYYLRTLNT
jgi:hypothetical protein